MKDFTAEDARKLKAYTKVSWEGLKSLKELIEEKAKWQSSIQIQFPDYHAGFSVQEVGDFLHSKGFNVKAETKYVSGTELTKSKRIQTTVTISW